jgi:NADH-quinone oxidoreductase subunit L
MEMQKLYLLVPLAPLVGAIIAGLFCRVIPRWVAHTVTIAGVAIACIASFVIFKDVMAGNTYNGPVYQWLTSGDYRFRGRFPDRPTDRDDDAGRHLGVADGAHLHHRLHAG